METVKNYRQRPPAQVKRRRLRPRGPSDGDGAPSGAVGDGGGGGHVDDDANKWSIATMEAVGAVHTMFTFDALADVQVRGGNSVVEKTFWLVGPNLRAGSYPRRYGFSVEAFAILS